MFPSCQSTAFGVTGHIRTQTPQRTHRSGRIYGLGVIAFFRKAGCDFFDGSGSGSGYGSGYGSGSGDGSGDGYGYGYGSGYGDGYGSGYG